MKSEVVYIILSFFVVQTFCGCKKDPVEKTADNSCTAFNTSDCFIGVSGTTIGADIRHLTFNKTNDQELIFLRKREGEVNQIIKYNLETKSESVLADDVNPGSDFSWSKLGWIAFHTSSSWKVWKLKDDGSEFTQLTFNPRDIGPEFHPNGDELIYARNMEYSVSELQNDPSLRNQYKLLTIDLEGNAIDSFCRFFSSDDPCFPWDLCAWSPDGENLVAPLYTNSDNDLYDLALYDVHGNETNGVFNFSSPISSIGDIEWHHDGELVFFNYDHGSEAKGSIMAWNTSTGDVNTIKKGCDSRSYRGVSISADGKLLASVRIDATHSDCEITQHYHPVVIDIKTGLEIELDLD